MICDFSTPSERLDALSSHAEDLRMAIEKLNSAAEAIRELQSENAKLRELLAQTMAIADRLIAQRR